MNPYPVALIRDLVVFRARSLDPLRALMLLASALEMLSCEKFHREAGAVLDRMRDRRRN